VVVPWLAQMIVGVIAGGILFGAMALAQRLRR
jgi:hypothetical protein